MSRAQRYFRRRCLNVPDLSAFGLRLWRGARRHTRWSAATRPAVVAASWFAGTGAPDSCWVTNHRGGVTHRVHSQLTYPYTTRTRGPVIPFQGWRSYFPINARAGHLASRCPSRLSAVRLSGWWVRVWVSPTSKSCLPQGAWAPHVLGGGGGRGWSFALRVGLRSPSPRTSVAQGGEG